MPTELREDRKRQPRHIKEFIAPHSVYMRISNNGKIVFALPQIRFTPSNM